MNMSHHHMMTPCGATIISSSYPHCARTNEIVQCCPAHTVPRIKGFWNKPRYQTPPCGISVIVWLCICHSRSKLVYKIEKTSQFPQPTCFWKLRYLTKTHPVLLSHQTSKLYQEVLRCGVQLFSFQIGKTWRSVILTFILHLESKI